MEHETKIFASGHSKSFVTSEPCGGNSFIFAPFSELNIEIEPYWSPTITRFFSLSKIKAVISEFLRVISVNTFRTSPVNVLQILTRLPVGV